MSCYVMMIALARILIHPQLSLGPLIAEREQPVANFPRYAAQATPVHHVLTV